jgi:hypothetical protein
MSHPVIRTLARQVRTRRVMKVLLLSTPVIIAAVFLFFKFMSSAASVGFSLAAMACIVALLVRSSRSVDQTLIARALNARVSALDDSVDLLLRDDATLSDLQRLQKHRIARRLNQLKLPDLRPAWNAVLIALIWVIAAAVAATVHLWPAVSVSVEQHEAIEAVAAPTAAQVTRLVASRLRVESPDYTGIAPRDLRTLETTVVEGSQLIWSLDFTTKPNSVNLVFHDGSHVALDFDGSQWIGRSRIVDSGLYRIVLEGAAEMENDALYRLDVSKDLAPEIRVVAPDRSLSVVDSEQKVWNLAIEATDDFAIGEAQVLVTLAQGSGEQVTVKEQSFRLRAQRGADPRRQRYDYRLDLQALGFAQGDDAIVRFVVADNRRPKANITRSASYILRWPIDAAAEADGIDGVVQKVLPAYFRSQRQIIIDSEALLAEKSQLEAAQFTARSDAIGVDQKILRLRYGQFLGEEFESGAAQAKPDPPHQHTEPRDAKPSDEEPAASLPEGHHHDDGHDHSSSRFGSAGDVVAEYGHTHDHAEAATLLDPETKKILKAALAEMWQAEMHLRLGNPAKALPYENRALGYIKQVQQSTRIYLSRVGLELPPVDESRRLSGDRTGVRDRRGTMPRAEVSTDVVGETWIKLESAAEPDLSALRQWLESHRDQVADPLSVHAAIDALQRDPSCSDCRISLREAIWPLLPRKIPGSDSRPEPDAVGRAYLDALQRETQR